MSDLFVLRPALPRDADDIARVHVETWQSTYAGLVPSGYLARMSVARSSPQWLRAAAKAEKGNDLMVAEVDHQVVGFVSFGPTRTPALPNSDAAPRTSCTMPALVIAYTACPGSTRASAPCTSRTCASESPRSTTRSRAWS